MARPPSGLRRSAPILAHKEPGAPSLFTPESLLCEARRQKALPRGRVPGVCVLDPDGDIVRYLLQTRRARRSARCACYHTDLHVFRRTGIRYGIVGGAIGAAFAVLVAEELFASGCRLLLSLTSAGQITAVREPPYFILIDRALRDEGTSYHYLPAADYSDADARLIRLMSAGLSRIRVPLERGATWTTDAPFRETAAAIEACRARGVLAVEMEAAALYAFARARRRPVVCFAHVTNRMARIEGDFEKGEADGAREALQVISAAACAWRDARRGS